MKVIINLFVFAVSSYLLHAQEVPSIYNTLYSEYYASAGSLEKLVCNGQATMQIEKIPGNNYSLSIDNADTVPSICMLDKFMLGDFIFRGDLKAEVNNNSQGFGFVFGLRDTSYYYARFTYEPNNDLLFSIQRVMGYETKTLTEGIVERQGQNGWDRIAVIRDIVTTTIKLHINYMEVPIETVSDRVLILGSVGYLAEPGVKLYMDNVKIWGPTVLDKIE